MRQLKWFGTFLAILLGQGFLMGALPSRFHDFAQVGDGGGIKTIMLVMNPSNETVTVTITFRKDDGSPLQITIGGTTNSVFQFTVAAGGMLRAATTGSSATPQVGWAQLRATREVGAQIFFEISTGNTLVTQAAVESPGPLRVADLFVEQQSGGARTGVALANLSASGSVVVRLTLRDETGAVRFTKEITLASLAKLAQFLDEIFQGLGNFRGVLTVNATGPLAILTLQQTGLVLGTLPPVEIF